MVRNYSKIFSMNVVLEVVNRLDNSFPQKLLEVSSSRKIFSHYNLTLLWLGNEKWMQ